MCALFAVPGARTVLTVDEPEPSTGKTNPWGVQVIAYQDELNEPGMQLWNDQRQQGSVSVGGRMNKALLCIVSTIGTKATPG